MLKQLVSLLVMVALLGGAAVAQGDSKPTVLVLLGGGTSQFGVTIEGTLDALQSYEFLSATERGSLMESHELDGDRISIILGLGLSSVADASALLERAMDLGVDAIVASTSTMAQLALSVTVDMEDPPAVIFTRVNNPYEAGIAEASCIKPDHVVGMVTDVPYEDIMALLLLQDPDLRQIGTIYSSSDSDGAFGADRIIETAGEMGLAVETAAVTGIADLRVAAQGLVSKGVNAIVLPNDLITGEGIPIMSQVAAENQIPVVYATPGAVYTGATIGGGSLLYYDEGDHAGILLVSYLNGDIDIAEIGIHHSIGMHHSSAVVVGVNLDVARMQGVEINDELLEMAEFVVEDGELNLGSAASSMFAKAGNVLSLEERRASDLTLLENWKCSDKMIAEQQAVLDAADE